MAHELIDLECAAWEALSSPAAATEFYADVLADDVLMLFPGGMVIDDRQAVIDSMQGAGWSEFTIDDERVLELSPDSAAGSWPSTSRPRLTAGPVVSRGQSLHDHGTKWRRPRRRLSQADWGQTRGRRSSLSSTSPTWSRAR